MNFQKVSSEILEDSTRRLILKVASEDLVYLGFILESFEGWCNYTTVNKQETLLQIDISPDYVDSTEELLKFLENWQYEDE